MRTPLLGLLVAATLSACGTVPPSPSASVVPTAPPSPSTPATPSPSPTAASPSALPSPTPSTPYTLDCGPLAGTPDDCAAAVEAGLRLLSLAPGDVSAVRVEAPQRTCSPDLSPCRAAVVVVKAYNRTGVAVGEAPLVKSAGRWISALQVR
jgi:hypothetical protein